jgi:hypothetical protein
VDAEAGDGLKGALASLDAGADEPTALTALAWLAARDVELDEDELRGALRRAVLLLATRGDPLRGLDLDGRAVTAVAADLDEPGARDAFEAGLSALRGPAEPFPRVRAALEQLLSDRDLAWRAFAAAAIADELASD